MQLLIGIDDVDSPYGMCTTYAGALIVEALSKIEDITFLDYPFLIRLNPNIPFKTRGNGAVAFHLEVPEYYYENLKEIITDIIKKALIKGKRKPEPVIVFSKRENAELRRFYEKALTSMVTLSYAERLVDKLGIEYYALESGKRGLIGALAAIGAVPLEEYTFELLMYRNPSKRGRRIINEKLVMDIDRRYRDYVFANFDFSSKRILAIPHGPDPVLIGIRSVNPLILNEIRVLLARGCKDLERWIIYKTNQGTGVHLKRVLKISAIKPYDSCTISGVISSDPLILKGGHVKVRVKDETGEIDCLFYRETGFLNKVARLLKPGDEVIMGGGVRPASSKHGLTLNVEILNVVKTVKVEKMYNPICPNCRHRMKSAGRKKGYKCPKCGFKTKKAEKEIVIKGRILEPGLYLPSPLAYRHLSKPRRLIGWKGTEIKYLVELWHFP
ncbi:MAG: hypothetical protein DRJ38_01235 [Thermoprotei archaeon]|nr:MAG: hypothetical protein DRJ38_01235 [Thermoprotei archaeon]